jgi:hypothetical protein
VNVNKLATAAQLRFNTDAALDGANKQRLRKLAGRASGRSDADRRPQPSHPEGNRRGLSARGPH